MAATIVFAKGTVYYRAKFFGLVMPIYKRFQRIVDPATTEAVAAAQAEVNAQRDAWEVAERAKVAAAGQTP